MTNTWKGQDGRGDYRLMDPREIEWILDPNDTANGGRYKALFDKRKLEPVDMSLVNSFLQDGQLQDIPVFRDGNRTFGIAGRRRGTAMVWIVENRDADFRARVVQRKLKPGQPIDYLADLVLIENFQRKDPGPTAKAEAAMFLQQKGRSIERIAVVLNFSEQHVRDLLKFGDAHPELLEAADKNEVSIKTVGVMTQMPRDEQKKMLDEMKAKGATKGKAAEQALKGAGVKTPVRVRPHAHMEQLAGMLKTIGVEKKDALLNELAEAIVWASGEEPAEDSLIAKFLANEMAGEGKSAKKTSKKSSTRRREETAAA